MKFATIIKEAGINEEFFPKCSEIDIVLYDDNDDICKEDDIHFVKNIFIENLKSFQDFINLIYKLNKNPQYKTINIQITQDCVIVFYKTNHPQVFLRKKPTDPIDYVD